MGFLRWVFGKHPVKAKPPPDPNKVVEAGRVPTWNAPIVIALLAERGIRATSAEVSLPHGSRLPLPQGPHAVIYVLEPDEVQAGAFIASYLSARHGDFDDLDEFEAEFDDDFDDDFDQ
jgi:hypothetical protein